MAYVTTMDLYDNTLDEEQKGYRLHDATGEAYGTIQKRDAEYRILCANQVSILYSGDFQTHHIRVLCGGQIIASSEPADKGAYQVSIEANVDAGLLLLGFLMIDKCERRPGYSRSAMRSY